MPTAREDAEQRNSCENFYWGGMTAQSHGKSLAVHDKVNKIINYLPTPVHSTEVNVA